MLDNTFYRLTHDKALTVGYFGGSITEGAGASDASKTSWRARTTAWFRENFPDATVTEIQAAIGGTGSDLGMYRCEVDLLSKKPDLVFIEFAVNDSGMPYDNILAQAEAIYRKIWNANAYTDIVCVMTTTQAVAKLLETGGEYVSRSAHSVIAHRYGAPVIDIGNVLHYEVLRTGGDFLRFTTDTVHPNDDGYQIYTDCVTGFLAKRKDAADGSYTAHVMPEKVCGKVAEDACMIDCVTADGFVCDGFTEVEKSMCGRYPRYIEATEPGSTLSFRFTGDTCAFYWMLAKDAGDVLVSVDGGKETLMRSWDHYCKAFNRAGAAFVAKELAVGEHTVTVRVAETKAEESEGTVIRIGAFLIS